MSLIAVLVGSFVFWKKAKDEYYDEHEVIDMVLSVTFWSLLGGRIAYVLINFNDFGLNILYWLSIWSKPGLHWFGLYSFALLAIIRFSRSQKWDIYQTLDLAVIGGALTQALLNLGIFLSGTSIGRVTNLPIGVMFPGMYQPRHPIGLYAFIGWILVFALLWWLEGKYRRFVWYQKYKGDALPGFMFSLYLIFSGLIGGLVAVISEQPLLFAQVNVDFSVRMILIVIGVSLIVFRSNLGSKLGLDALVWKNKKLSKK